MQVSSAAKRSVSASLGKMLLLAGGLIGAAIAVKLLPGTGGLQSLPTAHLSVAGLVALGAIACAVGVPRQVVAFVAGYGWGLLPGIALALAAQLLGCAANLFWARAVGRDFVRRRLGTRLARINTILARRPFAATLAIRLLPVGNNLALNLLAGAFQRTCCAVPDSIRNRLPAADHYLRADGPRDSVWPHNRAGDQSLPARHLEPARLAHFPNRDPPRDPPTRLTSNIRSLAVSRVYS